MRINCLLFVLLLLLPVKVLSLYNGNPSLPMMPEEGLIISREEWLGIKVGYELDYVYDRKLHMQGQPLVHMSKKVEKYHSLSNFGQVILNFNDRAELFGLLGAFSSDTVHHPLPGSKISYCSQSHFAWGVGGRAILAYWGDLQVGVNASYATSSPPLSSLKVNGRSYSTRHAVCDYTQWQVGAGACYRVDWFIPYIGIDYSNFRQRIKQLNAIQFLIPSKHVTFKGDYPFGIYLGLGLAPQRAFQLNLELRLINENAVSLDVGFKF